jgi:hypothetical protein
LDIVRPPLDAEVRDLRKVIEATNNLFLSHKADIATTIRQSLQAATGSLRAGAQKIFAQQNLAFENTNLPREYIRQITTQVIGDFLTAVRSAVDRHQLISWADRAPDIVRIIDNAMAELDIELARVAKLAEVGHPKVEQLPQGSAHAFDQLSFDGKTFDAGSDAVQIAADQRRRATAAIAADPYSQQPVTSVIVRQEEPRDHPPSTMHSGQPPTTVSSGRAVRAKTSVGQAVLDNDFGIALAGVTLLASLDARIADLKEKRANSDEAHALVAELEDLRGRVELFLAAAEEFSKRSGEEDKVVTAKLSFLDGMKDIWAHRHLQIAADPTSAIIAGTIVGGKKVVDALKAAAELAKAGSETSTSTK